MATYTHSANYPASGLAWIDIDINGDAPVSTSGTLIVLSNSDGTQTRLIGTFTMGGSSGTVTSITRTNVGGATLYEQVTGLSINVATLLNTETNAEAFNLIFAGVDALTGNSGNDFLLGGASGDSLNGGAAGSDYADYSSAPATSGQTGILVSLGNSALNTGHASGDTYTSIENIRGSAFDDNLNGSGVANIIYGGNGFDVLRGFGGNDTLYGGGILGTGLETVAPEDYRGGRADYISSTPGAIVGSINAVFNAGGSTVTGVGVGQNIGVDTLINVQQVGGTDNVDTFSVTADFAGMFANFAEFEGRGGNDTISGNSINTRISFANASAGVTVDLATQTMSGGGNTGIDNLSGIRQVRGSAQADTLSAVGVEGDIVFIGQGGDDQLTGNGLSVAGRDSAQAWYDNATAAVVITLSTVSTAVGATVGTDTLTDIFVFRGTDLDDTFSVDNLFDGPFGKLAVFEGMDGNDTFTGNGATRATYARSSSGVNVTINAGGTGGASSLGPDDQANIGVDTFLGGVRQVEGSHYGDVLTGSNDADAERFRAGSGNDSINGGGGTLDFVDFLNATGAVVVNLATNTVSNDGFGGTDTLSGIEGVTGSDHNDTITGDNGVNYLQGQGGNDTIVGGGGNDVMAGDDDTIVPGSPFGTSTRFDTGNDRLDGGAGNDTMIGGRGNDTYVIDSLSDIIQENADEGTDTLEVAFTYSGRPTNVEIVQLTGNAAIDLTGSIGADILRGNSATNTIIGGVGADVIVGQGGKDLMTGGAGLDRMVLESLSDSGVTFAARDVINTFAHGDKIDVSAIDAKTTVAGDQAFVFVAAFTGVAGQLQWDLTNVSVTGVKGYLVQGDINGDSVADFSLQVYTAPTQSLPGGPDAWNLASFDFIL